MKYRQVTIAAELRPNRRTGTLARAETKRDGQECPSDKTHAIGRYGVTLFEVVLALGIFAASAAAVSQLFTTGMQAAVRSRLQTQAILRCESKLNEVIAGAEALEAVSESSFEDDAAWLWSLEIATGPHADLLALTVTVAHVGASTGASAAYSLSRYVRDPLVLMDAASETQEATQ